MREYKEEFAEERKINEEFQRFVANLRITYEGRFFEKKQEGKFHIIYIYIWSMILVLHDEDEMMPGGSAFKELAKLFSDEITDGYIQL